MEEQGPADLLSKLREQILPVTVAVVFLAIAIFMFRKMPPAFTPEGIITWVLMLIVFPVMFGWFPAAVILYGWYSGNRAGAVLAGLLLFPLFFIVGFFVLSRDNMVFLPPPPPTIFFITVLSVICGLAGYCGARRTQGYLAVSVVLTGLGLIFLMSGIN